MFSTNRAKTSALVIGSIVLFFVVGWYILQTRQTKAENTSQLIDASVWGIFEGTTPCSGDNPPLPQIPLHTDCEMMTWKLTLHQDPATGNPTTYELVGAYGLAQQGTTGMQNGGTPIHRAGVWTQLLGTPDHLNAVVYQLNPDKPEEAIHFARMDDNLLHLLTPDKSLMVGNAGWSYTLNRTNQPVVSDTEAVSIDPQPITDIEVNPGVFDGRTPCIEAVLALHDITAQGCQRVKLRVVLNTELGAPTTFELFSIYVGKGDTRYRVTGMWTVLQGAPADAEAILYQLTPEDAQSSISFLRADDNHLFLVDAGFNLMVGDALTSFTLSRGEE